MRRIEPRAEATERACDERERQNRTENMYNLSAHDDTKAERRRGVWIGPLAVETPRVTEIWCQKKVQRLRNYCSGIPTN